MWVTLGRATTRPLMDYFARRAPKYKFSHTQADMA